MAKHSREGNIFYGEFGKDERRPLHPSEKKGVVRHEFSKPKEAEASLEVLNDFEQGFIGKLPEQIEDLAKGLITQKKLMGKVFGQKMALDRFLADKLLDLPENEWLKNRIEAYKKIISNFLDTQLSLKNKDDKNIPRGAEAFPQLYEDLNRLRLGGGESRGK